MLLPGHMLVDQGDDVETLRGRRESGDVAVLEGADAQAAGRSLKESLEQCVGSAQVEHRDGTRFAVDPAGLDDSPVGATVDDVALDAGHMFCVYTR